MASLYRNIYIFLPISFFWGINFANELHRKKLYSHLSLCDFDGATWCGKGIVDVPDFSMID